MHLFSDFGHHLAQFLAIFIPTVCQALNEGPSVYTEEWHMLSRSNSVEMALKANRGYVFGHKLNENTKPVATCLHVGWGSFTVQWADLETRKMCRCNNLHTSPLREEMVCGVLVPLSFGFAEV